jgi:hypothetical protein
MPSTRRRAWALADGRRDPAVHVEGEQLGADAAGHGLQAGLCRLGADLLGPGGRPAQSAEIGQAVIQQRLDALENVVHRRRIGQQRGPDLGLPRLDLLGKLGLPLRSEQRRPRHIAEIGHERRFGSLASSAGWADTALSGHFVCGLGHHLSFM